MPDRPNDVAECFEPLLPPSPRLLILGTMPGQASLRRRQYYGHPRNAFWSIMARLTGVAADADYAERSAALLRHGIALWDVLARCRRSGSLDAAIEKDSEVANDIPGLIARQPSLRAVCFNGKTAAALYRRHHGDTQPPGTAFVVLPSTSPAYAAMPAAEKRRRWLQALRQP